MRLFLFIILCTFPKVIFAQEDSIKAVIFLETVDIFGLEEDFDEARFIQQVIEDTTFYKAFMNMRYYSHTSEGFLKVYKPNDSEKGKVYRLAKHNRAGKYFYIDILKEKVKGTVVNRKGEYKYYTAEMFDYAFYPKDTLIADNTVPKPSKQDAESKLTQHKNDIRLMMFNPGTAISNVPFIGDKMAIFDDDMAPFYDYSIDYRQTKDSVECYVLSCKAKADSKPDDTVIKELITYFNAETMEVMFRKYHMKYNHFLFDFDVWIEVDLQKVKGAMVPREISYKGYWDVAVKKKEYVGFRILTSNWTIE